MRAWCFVFAGLVAAAAPAAAESVKVGAILTLSGPDATPGLQMDRGFRLYIKEHPHDLPTGVTINLIERDDTGPNPDVAKRLAQELITRDHIQFLTGVLWTPNAAAIAPIVTQAKIPFIDSLAAGVTIPRLSPYIVRVSFTLWQTSYPLGQWAAKERHGKAYSLVADYAPGNDAENGFAAGFTEGGGEIAGKSRFPLSDLNFTPYLERMADAKAQTAFIFVPVGSAVTMMRDVANLDLAQKGITLVSTMDIVPDEQLQDMGDSTLGLVTSGNYSAAATRPANKAFVAAWKRAYGDKALPDFAGVEAWDSMAAIYAVLKATGGTVDADKAMAILSHWKDPASPRGPIAIDPATRDIVENIYMRKVEKVNGRLANVEFATIPDVKDPWKERNPEKK
ncbi:MAG TPA: ABC transporter substrate-binding protein [Stellaceae bacterium]|nr:ABC transporter substrate-binding protein [Stellaceae bacterium]